MNKTLTTLAAAVIAVIALAACGTAKAHSAASAAAPVVSSTFTQQQISTLESELTAAFQVQLAAHPGHLITDAKAAVRQVFPYGDTSAILANAAQHLTPAVATSSGPGSARALWAREVITFAVTSGGVTPSAEPGPLGTTSTASIPGYSSASPSVSS